MTFLFSSPPSTLELSPRFPSSSSSSPTTLLDVSSPMFSVIYSLSVSFLLLLFPVSILPSVANLNMPFIGTCFQGCHTTQFPLSSVDFPNFYLTFEHCLCEFMPPRGGRQKASWEAAVAVAAYSSRGCLSPAISVATQASSNKAIAPRGSCQQQRHKEKKKKLHFLIGANDRKKEQEGKKPNEPEID